MTIGVKTPIRQLKDIIMMIITIGLICGITTVPAVIIHITVVIIVIVTITIAIIIIKHLEHHPAATV
jgi:hypothetical protein